VEWNKHTVLVTGAGGFIASHLAERLAALGARTRALVRYRSSGDRGWLAAAPAGAAIEVFAGDVRDPDSLRRAMAGVDVVFHLAALIAIPYSYEAPLSYVRTNVEGTLNVLEAARAAGALCVHTSTSEVYGTARYVPIDEQHPLSAQSPYAATKVAADQLALAFHRSFGIPVVVVRPFNTYGPRQSARAVIPSIVAQALARPTIRLGSLTPTRDLCFVADTVDGFVRAAQTPAAVGEVIQLATGAEISIGDLARKVLARLGKDLPIESVAERVRPTASEVERLCGDGAKARALLGWTPAHSLDQGLDETIAWIQRHLDAYRPDDYAV
jgi:dTDP-glucose 4,6-dehydratase